MQRSAMRSRTAGVNHPPRDPTRWLQRVKPWRDCSPRNRQRALRAVRIRSSRRDREQPALSLLLQRRRHNPGRKHRKKLKLRVHLRIPMPCALSNWRSGSSFCGRSRNISRVFYPRLSSMSWSIVKEPSLKTMDSMVQEPSRASSIGTGSGSWVSPVSAA